MRRVLILAVLVGVGATVWAGSGSAAGGVYMGFEYEFAGCAPRLMVIRTCPLSRCNSLMSVDEISRTNSLTSWLRAARLGTPSCVLFSLLSGSLTIVSGQWSVVSG